MALCVSPLLIHDPAYPSDVKRYISVPCGKCYACMSHKRDEMTARLLIESRYSAFSLFVTYTYDDEHINTTSKGNHTLKKRDFQLYLKKVRKELDKKDCSLRYFYVGEYGDGLGRPHFHAALFFSNLDTYNLKLFDLLETKWSFGLVHFGDLNQPSMHYLSKYMLKETSNPYPDDEEFEYIFHEGSRKPGLGSVILDASPALCESVREYELHKFDAKLSFEDKKKLLDKTRLYISDNVVYLPKFVRKKIANISWSPLRSAQYDRYQSDISDLQFKQAYKLFSELYPNSTYDDFKRYYYSGPSVMSKLYEELRIKRLTYKLVK